MRWIKFASQEDKKQRARDLLVADIEEKLAGHKSHRGREMMFVPLDDVLDWLDTRTLKVVSEYAHLFKAEQRLIMRVMLMRLVDYRWMKEGCDEDRQLNSESVEQVVFHMQTIPVFESAYPGNHFDIADKMMDFAQHTRSIRDKEDLSLMRVVPYGYALHRIVEGTLVRDDQLEHVEWLNTNYGRLLPVLPMLMERGTTQRSVIEMLLDSNHSSVLAEGAL